MTRRPRMEDNLFELLEDKKEHRNQSIGEVLIQEFPELEEQLEKNDKDEKLFEEEKDSMLSGGLLD